MNALYLRVDGTMTADTVMAEPEGYVEALYRGVWSERNGRVYVGLLSYQLPGEDVVDISDLPNRFHVLTVLGDGSLSMGTVTYRRVGDARAHGD